MHTRSPVNLVEVDPDRHIGVTPVLRAPSHHLNIWLQRKLAVVNRDRQKSVVSGPGHHKSTMGHMVVVIMTMDVTPDRLIISEIRDIVEARVDSNVI